MPEFTVIGHRGSGMNSLSSPNQIKENSILSFNAAARSPIQFVEFDVQVTADNHPIIFHDIFILTGDEFEPNTLIEKRVTDLSLLDFLSYNHKPLLRRAHDGRIFDWTVESDDRLCTLAEALDLVDARLGFNIELKFDDDVTYREEDLARALQIVLDCVSKDAGSRSVIFSTFHPDAARLVRSMQSDYPVLFLTDGGTEIYGDERRNSLAEAVKLCSECGLHGIVAEVRAVLGSPSVVLEVGKLGLSLYTYGEKNNFGEVVYLQRLMGVNGVIVDKVGEIAEAVSTLWGGGEVDDGDESCGSLIRREFSQSELAALLKIIPDFLVRNLGEMGIVEMPTLV